MSNLDIARRRRNQEVKILEIKRQYAKDHLNDGAFGGFGPDYDRMMLRQREARAQSIEEMTRQIAELQGLDDAALTQRFCPELPPELKEALTGVSLIDTLARGACR
jgi:hypothetical protein